jgi:hypothetical protein
VRFPRCDTRSTPNKHREQAKTRALSVSSRDTQAFDLLGQPLASASRFAYRSAAPSRPRAAIGRARKQPRDGAVAQMGERCDRTAEARDSTPPSSTIISIGYGQLGRCLFGTIPRTEEQHGTGTRAKSVRFVLAMSCWSRPPRSLGALTQLRPLHSTVLTPLNDCRAGEYSDCRRCAGSRGAGKDP